MFMFRSRPLLVTAPLAFAVSACSGLLWYPEDHQTAAPVSAATAPAPVVAQAPTSRNNDDYYEAHHEGRLYVFDDFATYRDFLNLGETPYRLTRIGAGPKGQTVVFGLTPEDKKKRSGVAAVAMFDGQMQGAETGFYAEVFHDNRFHVFDRWADLQAFRQTGEAALRYTDIGAGPGGRTVIYVLNSDNKQQRPDGLIAEFRARHG